MPNYTCQDRAKWADRQDGGVFFDYLFQTACKTCFHPLNAGDLCPDCQKLVDEEKREEDEKVGRWLSAILSDDGTRFVHVYGIGRVDTWSREGKQYLDD